MKLRDPGHEVVIERNKPEDTFGWGVVLSDETLDNLAANDKKSAEAIRAHFAYWDDIALHYKGETLVSSGHGFCGIGRKKLLVLLQARARELDVDLRFETEVGDIANYQARYDLVVASDGLNSKIRAVHQSISNQILIYANANLLGFGPANALMMRLPLFLKKQTKDGFWRCLPVR